MEHQLYLNGKALYKPPLTISQKLELRLKGNDLKESDVTRFNQQKELQIIDLDGMKSTYIHKNPLFQSLQQQIMNWNESVTLYRTGQIELPNGAVDDTLYRSLRNQLIEVANCRNRTQQENYLEKVGNWYSTQISVSQRLELSKSLIKQTQETFQVKSLQDDTTQYQSAQDYMNNYRSIHKDIDPPEDRVKTYYRKQLYSEISTRPGTVQNNNNFMSSQFTRPQTSQTSYKMADAFEKLSRPRTNQQSSRQQYQSDGTFQIISIPVRQDSPLKTEKPVYREEEGNEEESPEKESPEKESPDLESPSMDIVGRQGMRIRKNAHKYISTAPEKQPYKTDLQTEFAYQIEEIEVEDQLAHSRLNQIYNKNRQNEVKGQREDQELITHIKEWANNKGRIDEMKIQKGYLGSIGSQYCNVGIKISEIFQPKPQQDEDEIAYGKYLEKASNKTHKRVIQSAVPSVQPPIINNDLEPTKIEAESQDFQVKQALLENSINSQKLSNLKRSRGNFLPGGIHKTTSSESLQIRRMQSSSCFKNSQTYRPFSGVFNNYSIKQESNKQISEIKEIKHRLASANQFVPLKTLQKSLVIPTGHNDPTKIPLPYPLANLSEKPKKGGNGKGGKKKTTKK